MLRCSTESISGDSNFEKTILTSEGERHSVLKEGILSRKKLTSGRWLLSEKLLLFGKDSLIRNWFRSHFDSIKS